MVQAFRREVSIYESARFPPRGLEADGRYRVTDVDAPEAGGFFTGHELMRRGLAMRVMQQPGAVVVTYREALPARVCGGGPAVAAHEGQGKNAGGSGHSCW